VREEDVGIPLIRVARVLDPATAVEVNQLISSRGPQLM
jgi:hypothetical protein